VTELRFAVVSALPSVYQHLVEYQGSYLDRSAICGMRPANRGFGRRWYDASATPFPKRRMCPECRRVEAKHYESKVASMSEVGVQ